MNDYVSDSTPATAWRWGDDYLLVPARRQLTGRGAPIDVEDRALDLIMLLLLHRARALDRQEVISAIWGKRPVSDATLRQLVFKARRAVGDDGEHQHAICTLYGRSLQWIAPVEMVFESGEGSPANPPVPVVAAQPPTRLPRPRRGVVPAAALVVLVALGATAGAWFLFSPRHAASKTAAPSPRLAITPIENATGDAKLAWVSNGLPGLLGSLLDQAGGINVVDAKQVAHALKFKPTQGRNHEQQLRFVTNADVVVGGRLRKLAGKLYELDLHVQPGSGRASDVVVTGSQPGLLAVDAVQRIRAQSGLAERARPATDRLLRDPFLAEAYARGIDLQARGKIADSLDYFKLCVALAPDFLPCRYDMGIGQLDVGDAGGVKTLQALLPVASRGEPRLAARVLFQLANHARMTSSSADALAYLRKALPFAQRAGDVETVVEIQLLTAITAHRTRDMKLSAAAMADAEVLLQRNPGMRHARELLSQARGFIAGEGGNPEAAIEPARTALALAVEDGNERFAVTALGSLAVALSAAHHTGEAITVAARAMQRAHAGQLESLEATDSGNLALGLIGAGLPEAAIGFGDRQYKLSGKASDVQEQAIALLINMTADLQALDGAKALQRLQRGDALAWDSMDPEIVLDRWLYEAMAAYLADPGVLPALLQRADAYSASHKLAAGLMNRVHFIRALAAAANGRKGDADTALKAAVAAGHLDTDGDLELRMTPLLIALHDHDSTAAALALKGYDPATTRDAAILRPFAQWMRQTGDTASAGRATARLAQLRKIGVDALASAGLDAAHLDGPVPSSARGSAD